MNIFSLFRGTDLAGGVRRAAERGATLVDVRTPEEFAEGHVPGAVNIPLGTLAAAKLPAGELYVYCHSGARSAQAVRYLKGGESKPKTSAASPATAARWKKVFKRGTPIGATRRATVSP